MLFTLSSKIIAAKAIAHVLFYPASLKSFGSLLLVISADVKLLIIIKEERGILDLGK
jgi:hypothetical protein